MNDLAEELMTLRKQADDVRVQLSLAEAELKRAEAELADVQQKLFDLGVTPDTVEDRLAELEAERMKLQTELTTLLEDLRERLSKVSN